MASERLRTAVGFPHRLRIGDEGWTRFRVRVPRGQSAARVDLAYAYRIPSGSPERPLMFRHLPLFRFASTEEYFATVQNACRS